MLEVKNLVVHFKGRKTPILNNVCLKLKPGFITTIVGLSGSGKTTLLSCINGVLNHEKKGELQGEIYFDNKCIMNAELTELSKSIGTVYQDPDTQIVFSSVYAELAFALENFCYEPSEIKERIDEVVSELHIEHLIHRHPNELSGGEKQLVVLASILVLEPKVLLLDEIMAQVDEKGSKLIKDSIISLKQKGKMILMIEHDLNHLDIADEVLVMKDGRLDRFDGTLI
jgi:energy-coupling factor transport system ATP-binding protein